MSKGMGTVNTSTSDSLSLDDVREVMGKLRNTIGFDTDSMVDGESGNPMNMYYLYSPTKGYVFFKFSMCRNVSGTYEDVTNFVWLSESDGASILTEEMVNWISSIWVNIISNGGLAGIIDIPKDEVDRIMLLIEYLRSNEIYSVRYDGDGASFDDVDLLMEGY